MIYLLDSIRYNDMIFISKVPYRKSDPSKRCPPRSPRRAPSVVDAMICLFWVVKLVKLVKLTCLGFISRVFV